MMPARRTHGGAVRSFRLENGFDFAEGTELYFVAVAGEFGFVWYFLFSGIGVAFFIGVSGSFRTQM
jgi:hypothetical protein